jgi:hypothetical protein
MLQLQALSLKVVIYMQLCILRTQQSTFISSVYCMKHYVSVFLLHMYSYFNELFILICDINGIILNVLLYMLIVVVLIPVHYGLY